MSRQIIPLHSKNHVNRAGILVRDGNYDAETILIIENWRASHNYILNTFQASLRKRTRGTDIVFAQRLKRRPTIFDKLMRENGMSLSRMHDIAGCRLIFKNEQQLREFNSNFRKARFDHVLISGDNRYDYIDNPKNSGYRGLHDVYRYNVRSDGGKPWNGLHLEIQYRTVFQHAWATAVEIAGSITDNNPKFNRGDARYIEFFQVCSEIISRTYEDKKSCLPNKSMNELKNDLNNLENQIGLIRAFQGLNAVTKQFQNAKYVILMFDKSDSTLKIQPYQNQNKAIDQYNSLEKQTDLFRDVVLVRSDSDDKIKNAFRNYFSDTDEFISLIRKAIK